MILSTSISIGHAIETWSLKNQTNPVSHGEAVAAGMICESYLSFKLCGLPETEVGEISKHITSLFPVIEFNAIQHHEIIHYVKADKKSSSGTITYALLSAIGNPVLHTGVDDDLLKASLEYYNSL